MVLCQDRVYNQQCRRVGDRLVTFPEGERADQYLCGKHADRVWMTFGHYIPGKGGCVVKYIGKQVQA